MSGLTQLQKRLEIVQFQNYFETNPIRGVEELTTYSRQTDSPKVIEEDVKSPQSHSKTLMVCHDMRGNYLNDRY